MEASRVYDQVSLPFPEVRFIESVKLRYSKIAFRALKYTDSEGISSEVKSGAWAFYVPERRLKLLHTRQGKQTCLSKAANRFVQPNTTEARDNMQARESGTKVGSYFVQDWERALAKPVFRRVAETWIAARRLANAGLGPDVSEIMVVRKLYTPYERTGASVTAGFVQEDAWALPAGPHADDDAMIAAGVKPDQIRSCIRQPINGYVVDLNSVVGVEPLNAEAEIAALVAHIEAS